METTKYKVLQVKSIDNLKYRSNVRIVDVPVAEVNKAKNVTELLEVIFYYGQNYFQPKNSLSLSTGDVVVIEDKFYLCESFGWAEIETIE